MAVEQSNTFIATEATINHLNGHAWLNVVSEYTYLDELDDEQNFDFPGYSSSYMDIYDSEGRNKVVKSYASQITRNSNVQVINASVSDMTFEAQGIYYYVLGYITTGGYEVPLRYGKFVVK